MGCLSGENYRKKSLYAPHFVTGHSQKQKAAAMKRNGYVDSNVKALDGLEWGWRNGARLNQRFVGTIANGAENEKLFDDEGCSPLVEEKVGVHAPFVQEGKI